MMLFAQTFVFNKFLCCILGEHWLREDDVDSAINRFMKGVSKETLSNDLVEVCVGPLFTHKDEFHVQTIQPFRMPDESDIGRSLWWCISGCAPLITLFPPHTSYTQAQSYWRNEAPFRGVPFKTGLSAAQISRVLKVFGQNGANCESAVTNFLICLVPHRLAKQ